MFKSDISRKILSDITVYSKYSKFVPVQKRRETWEEIALRNLEMHCAKYPQLADEIRKNYIYVLDKKVLPSMRALEDSTPIITKTGWKLVKDIQEGDILYSSDGTETKVIGTVSFKDKDLYQVNFNDGSSLVACNEHLWIVETNDDLSNKTNRVVDTLYLKKHIKQSNRNNIHIKNAKAIVRDKVNVVVDPYILGLWLGDGYSNGTQYAAGPIDAQFMKEQYESLGYVTSVSGTKNKYAFNVKGLKNGLKTYGLIKNKHVPEIYLRGSIPQRLSLIQGLMDTDGCCFSGRCLFTNTNQHIISGVKELLNSLGVKYTETIKDPIDNHKKIWTISFFTELECFRLPRKLKIQNSRVKSTNRVDYRIVKSVEYIGKGNATCFHVDSDNSSFLAGKNMIVTHNSMQFAGKPIELSPNRIFNCSFLAVDDYHAFSEAMFLLLGGTGFGYSVQKHHVEKLPAVHKPTKKRRFLIGDSIEGWADAVKALFQAYMNGKPFPVFDFRDIRAKGARLVTSGGKAPGPEPLKECLFNIQKILDRKEHETRLTTLECHDIMCYIADAVLAGGIRRAAMISLFTFDDEDMLTCKYGNWYELEPQRARANNSVVILRHRVKEKDFKKLWEKIKASGSGEPGIFFTNNKDMGINPCAEISLKSAQMCNLTEINASDIESQEDLNQRARVASFIGTLQAGYTEFHYLREIWQKNCEKDALLGVSMTGICSGSVLKYNLEEAANIVVEENKRVAKLIGINPAARTTCIKPSGTTSLVCGSSSGIHEWHADYYIRRVRLGKNEPLYKYLLTACPDLLEDDVLKAKTQSVLSVPQKAPEGAITRANSDPLKLLERVKRFSDDWIIPGHITGDNRHNVSVTVSVKDEEFPEVGEWLWKNRDTYTGITILPYHGGNYAQMPFEECTEEEYTRMLRKVKDIDLTKVLEDDDNTKLTDQVACAGGACEIKSV